MLPVIGVSKPYSDEEEKLPVQNRTKQKRVGWKDTLELVTGPRRPWAVEAGRASESQGSGDSNGPESLGRT